MSFSVRRLKDKPRRSFPWKRALVIAMTVSKPIMGLYKNWKAKKDEEHRVVILKRVLLVLFSVFFALLMLAGIAKALVAIHAIGLNTLVAITGEDLPVDAHGYHNFLLLGQGDQGHDGVDLTDTMMIASVDPGDTKSVVIISLPRDLYLLKTEKMGVGRINSLYRDYKGYLRGQGMETADAEEEALKVLRDEIGRQMGMQIHHAIKVDFVGFEKAVDAVGGVDINVPYDIVDMEYPDENYGYQTFAISAGPQHLDGATALKYARSRHTTSDFDRSARQQQLIVALADQAKAKGLHKDVSTVTEILKILAENMDSTMSVREMITLGGLADSINQQNVIAMQLNDRNGLYGSFTEPGGFLYAPPRDQFQGAAVLLPVSIPEFPVTWRQIHTLVDVLFNTREVYLRHPPIAVLNGTKRSGIGRGLAGELIRYGFDVPIIDNAGMTEVPEETFLFADNETNKDLAEFFSNLLQIPVKAAPVEIPFEVRGTVTIVLGTDFQYQPLQDLVPQPEEEEPKPAL